MAKGGSSSPQETAADRAVAEVAKGRVDDFRQRWAPQQRKLATQIDAMGAPDSFERRRAAGAVTADTDVAFANVADKALSNTAQVGGLGSSGQKLGIGDMADAQATTVGLGTNNADLGVDAARLKGLTGVVARGQGKQASADSGLVAEANMQRQVANEAADAALQRDMGTAMLVGKAAGVAAGQFSSPNGLDPAKTGIYQERGSDGFGRPVNTRAWGYP